MNKHKCGIDFEKHTPLMHVTLLVEKTTTIHTELISSHTYTLIQHAL